MIVYTCAKCKHYTANRKCEAFPFKIPDVIWQGDSGHENPLPEQKNKIVFDAITKNDLQEGLKILL